MARRLKSVHLDSKEARARLKQRGKPYWTTIERGRVHLGYRRLGKSKDGTPLAGPWIVRHYVGNERYLEEGIGVADDLSDADGITILNFDQAVVLTRGRMTVRAENAIGKNNRPWTVQDAMDDYLTYLEHEKKSARDARYKAEAFILPTFGQREIASLTVDNLRKWLSELAKSPARLRTAKKGKRAKKQQHRELDPDDVEAKRQRRATANRVLTIFRAALNRAFNDGKVGSDLAWRRLEGFKQVDAARQDFLTVEDAKRLINASNPDFRNLVHAGLLTGCRYGELARLKVSDFNARSETIAIGTSKSGDPRHVILTSEGVAFFANLTRGRAKTDPMLLRADGQPWGDAHQIRPMRETCKRARINPPIGFHALRHTWASLSVMGGVPLMIIARNMGHTSTRMVEKHYGHLLQSYEKEQIRAGAPKFGIKLKSNVADLRDDRR